MNRILAHNPNWGSTLNNTFHSDFLISQGLNPTTEFLDCGCGALAPIPKFENYKDWFYPITFFEEVQVGRYGYKVVKEWEHSDDKLGVDTLIYFPLKELILCLSKD